MCMREIISNFGELGNVMLNQNTGRHSRSQTWGGVDFDFG